MIDCPKRRLSGQAQAEEGSAERNAMMQYCNVMYEQVTKEPRGHGKVLESR